MKVYVDDNEDYRITYSSRDGSECLESMGMQPIIVESLADHDKQVRKEVVQEIIGKLCRIEDTLINLGNGKEDALNYFVGILKEIEQGETDAKD